MEEYLAEKEATSSTANQTAAKPECESLDMKGGFGVPQLQRLPDKERTALQGNERGNRAVPENSAPSCISESPSCCSGRRRASSTETPSAYSYPPQQGKEGSDEKEETTAEKTSRNPFPLDVLPRKMREIIDEANTTLGFPKDYLAMSMLTAVAAAVGNTHNAEHMAGWQNTVFFSSHS